jgi:hypothetical protein
MAWTTPNTAAAGGVVSASDHNTYIRDNLSFLLNGKAASEIQREGSADYTVVGTTWTEVDSTNLRITLSVTSGRVLLISNFRLAADNTASSAANVRFYNVTSAVAEGGTNGLAYMPQNREGQVNMTAIITGLAAGSYTFTLQFRNAQAGATTTINNNPHPITFSAIEL